MLHKQIDELLIAAGIAPHERKNKQRRSDASNILRFGHENTKQLVRIRAVGIQAAACLVREVSIEEQASMTAADIKRIGNKIQARAGTERMRDAQARRIARNEAGINAALRRAATPRVTDKEFERPPPHLLNQQFPGREPGVTYATVHREEHGPIWHNVAERRRYELARKLKDMAAELEKAMEGFATLDPEQQESVHKRWRMAARKIRQWIDLGAVADAQECDQETIRETTDRVNGLPVLDT